MQPDLEALLKVQQHDDGIREIEREKAAISPRLASLNKASSRMEAEVASLEATLQKETAKQRKLELDVAEHRARHDKNVEILNNAQKLKEATAAAAQVESARKVLADEESVLHALNRRISDLSSALAATSEALEALKLSQADERAQLDAESALIDARIRDAMVFRDAEAAKVPASLLSRYDRVSTRRKSQAVFALRNFTCGSCDTAIPLQRRPKMLVGRQIEVCEACGVLLYLAAPEEAKPTE